MSENDLQDLLLALASAAGLKREVPEVLAQAVNGLSPASESGATSAREINELSAQLSQLRAVNQGQTEAVAENTQAVIASSVAQASSGQASFWGSTGSVLSTVFKSGLGLSPLISGLVSLFRGSISEPVAPLLVYAQPQPIQLEAAVTRSTGGDLYPLSYDQYGWPRAVADSGVKATPQITIQVQAIDSRSFLDHSDEIARAVREAMLNSHSLNDVVNEL